MDKFFDDVFDVILEHEGGLSDDPNDPGDITKYGISLKFLESEGVDIDGDGDSDADDIRALTKKFAKEIYYHRWWLKYRYERITNLTVATKVVDLAINMGANRAHKVVQRAVNHVYPGLLVVDGILGVKSLVAINHMPEKVLMDEIRLEAKEYYLSLVERNPKLNVFINGWLRRAEW